MRVGITIAQAIDKVVQRILLALDHQLTFDENFRVVQMSVTTPGVANTEFTVIHNLGKTPVQYIANVDKGAVVYDSRRASWTESEMYLKCNTATVVVYLTVT